MSDHLLNYGWSDNRFWLWWWRRGRGRSWRTLLHASDDDFVLDFFSGRGSWTADNKLLALSGYQLSSNLRWRQTPLPVTYHYSVSFDLAMSALVPPVYKFIALDFAGAWGLAFSESDFLSFEINLTRTWAAFSTAEANFFTLTLDLTNRIWSSGSRLVTVLYGNVSLFNLAATGSLAF
jgi:hypothetical protein